MLCFLDATRMADAVRLLQLPHVLYEGALLHVETSLWYSIATSCIGPDASAFRVVVLLISR